MKKVAILTQPLHTNYGGTLQAYALQKTLRDMGGEVVTLNYQWKQKGFGRYILVVIKNHLLNRKEKFPFLPKEQEFREKNHRKFIEENIVRSEVIFSEEDLLRYFREHSYDVVIVGSDQVWRVEYSPNIDHFFLNFLKKPIKKIAYAASFGVDSWQFSPEKTQKIKQWLSDFEMLSVREDSGVNLCKDYLDIHAQHVLDPTLLLDKKDYINLIQKFSNNDNSIFTYILDGNSEKNKIIHHISNKLNLLTFKKQPDKTYKTELFVSDENKYVYPKIEEWLCAFRDASFVVTDSFHGTVFSIIFNKPFIAISNSERGTVRFQSLLKIFGLEHRLISCYENLDDTLIFEKIDYSSINDKLEIERNKSLSFIKSALA